MTNLNPESAPFIPPPIEQSLPPKFTSHPSLSTFTIPFSQHIANRLATTPPPTLVYRYVAVGALVFSNHADADEPRVLLIRRSPNDSWPLHWEIPGGAAEPEDASILHACARELYEEAGLVATSIISVVNPEGRLFVTGSGNLVCKFEFIVSVQGDASGGFPQVKLDPNEHVEYLWATERECEERRIGSGDEATALLSTDEAQRKSVLDGFRLIRDSGPRTMAEHEVSSAL
ncbi:hypothetical protein H2200_000351 [Cladophialophora chaetospira]|uniref:Nudix hydrolase domain-containing protein n=1 Tax=Cladophialophora chaetospira TaxID=386627 RepID=A0AA39CQ91_9EURO|nr:hypothetical protein H2200_000351 [Cladophialophora chaetospira]